MLRRILTAAGDDVGITRPTWTRRVAPLRETWSTPATPRMQAIAGEATPAQLTARGLLVSHDSLW